ncbi:MAG: nitronate monooxygenase [Acidimicrobiia bacterium]|nr:nitronate monooxygenase [Acidimicrobiia bacterium]
MFDLRELARLPIVGAPMGGGPTTPELVAAVGDAGGLGFLAAGYKGADTMQAEMAAVRASTDASYGVNVFLPNPQADPAVVATYVRTLEPDASRLETALGEPSWDDDEYPGKVEALLADPPPIVSFTFGCPERDVVAAFRDAGAAVAVTVTRPEEAAVAAAAGADCLCVQGIEAGAHQGGFANSDEAGQDFGLLALLGEVRRVCDLPMIAAGAVAGPRAVTAVLAAGAVAAQAGTALLRCPESRAHPVYKAALVDERFTVTSLTRAFSGRRARGLLNQFMRDHPDAPAAYPEVNNATRPLRAAAAACGDANRMSLWAGQGFRYATDRPAGEVVELLARGADS